MHEAVAEDDRMVREVLRRSLRDKRASLAEGLVRAMSADVCAAIAALPAFGARAASRSTRRCAARSIRRSSPGSCTSARAEVAYPRVVSTVPPILAFCDVAPGETLATGRFGIPEPRAAAARRATTSSTSSSSPASPSSRAGHRLGFGDGYYDRALSGAPRALRIGVVPRLPAGRRLAAARRRRARRSRSNPARAHRHRRSRRAPEEVLS